MLNNRTFRGALTAPTLALALCLPLDAPAAQELPPESRQFDFWVGAWDVNLRIRQDDFTWLDSVQSRAQIFSILGGKAILELWDSQPIKGYSLRYFDVERGEWVLWLNWPNPNASGSNSIAGSFRHGRGEFGATRSAPDGTETIVRYTFADIGPEKFRWEDAFSTDGGNHWTNNWIMEFSRTADVVELPEAGGPAHTYIDGSRCTLPQFRALDALAGRRVGLVGDQASTMTGYQVLDGCAVIAITETPGGGGSSQGFLHLTYNTYASRYELTNLDGQPDSSAQMFYSQQNSEELVLYPGWQQTPDRRVRFDMVDGGEVRVVWETPEDDGWVEAFTAVFQPPS
ncbi:MAG: hypothetical protein GKS06_09190 [Acidobacteria bacterium]|nr:hypothetical protein [Acidobacteriota bacterium]